MKKSERGREGGREGGIEREREKKRESHIITNHSIVVRCYIIYNIHLLLYLCVCIHVVCIKHSLSFIYTCIQYWLQSKGLLYT